MLSDLAGLSLLSVSPPSSPRSPTITTLTLQRPLGNPLAPGRSVSGSASQGEIRGNVLERPNIPVLVPQGPGPRGQGGPTPSLIALWGSVNLLTLAHPLSLII